MTRVEEALSNVAGVGRQEGERSIGVGPREPIQRVSGHDVTTQKVKNVAKMVSKESMGVLTFMDPMENGNGVPPVISTTTRQKRPQPTAAESWALDYRWPATMTFIARETASTATHAPNALPSRQSLRCTHDPANGPALEIARNRGRKSSMHRSAARASLAISIIR